MRGYWSGVATGLIAALAIGLALALAFPPFVFQEPQLGTDQAPGVLKGPSPSGLPNRPENQSGVIEFKTASPLDTSQIGAESAPGIPGLGPLPAPDVFDGAASGSPSLFSPSAEN